MMELWLVVITDIQSLQPATRISGEREIHRTLERCERERDYLVQHMREKGFEVTATCEAFRVVQ